MILRSPAALVSKRFIRLIPERLTGVFVGISTWDDSQIQTTPTDHTALPSFSALGTSLSIAAARIAHCLDLRGRSRTAHAPSLRPASKPTIGDQDTYPRCQLNVYLCAGQVDPCPPRSSPWSHAY